MILLDTDVLVDFVRGYLPCRLWLLSKGGEPVSIPGYVAMELYAGCGNKREQQLINRQLANYQILWPDEASASSMVSRFADAHLAHATGILDSLIAATALFHHLPLYTFNRKHFAAFPELQTIQPYVR